MIIICHGRMDHTTTRQAHNNMSLISQVSVDCGGGVCSLSRMNIFMYIYNDYEGERSVN